MTTRCRSIGLMLILALIPVAGRADPSIDVIEKLMVQDQPKGLAEIRERLWSTPLGLMLNEYLFENQSPAEVTRQSHALSRRTYSSAAMILPRLAALSIMTTDLFERGVVDGGTNIRIAQLEKELSLKSSVSKERTTSKIISLFGNLVLISVAAGSPVVREQAALVTKRLVRRANPFVMGSAEPGPGLYDQGTRRLVRDNFSKDYDYVYGMNFFLSSYASAAVYYNLFEEGAHEGDGISARFLHYLLQSHTRLEYL